MSLKTDRNGMFIYGMTNTDELPQKGKPATKKYRHLECSGNTLRKFITKVCHPCNVIEAALIVATQVFPARKWSGTAS
jgi:hypothetical protein